MFLAHVLGWRGVYLEPDDAAFAALERRYAANPRVRTLQAAVEPDTVEDLFAQRGLPEEPDVVSIDVDGNDYWIWRALERFRPRVVIVEYNGSLDPRLAPRDALHARLPLGPHERLRGVAGRARGPRRRRRATGSCTRSRRA